MKTKYAIGLFALAILLLHPLTRSIILWILPLGYRPDDLLFIGAVLIIIVPWMWGFPQIPSLIRSKMKGK